ncbi:tyrosine-protein phosphatase [Clostridium tyrobutyricum]|uniref:tyrosine-protein phosphatase n=1 Tax=Clostridium tyrobutyricum TaxID=1519 RepID=UPI0020CB1ADB|nr:CpsB/CapC family capsule biosynthesis tyrosine phosphatase [Clostridium tyrobutyricum]
MHIHLLPGIDDGSKSMDETRQMLRMIEQDGIHSVIATPHFYRGHYENYREDVEKLVHSVNEFADESGINVKLFSGQEVFLDDHTVDEYECGHIAPMDKTNYMLVELPMIKMPENAMDIVYELKIRGIKPIMAHPERYKYIIENPEKINLFVDEGCLLQLNAGSICGKFGSDVKKTAHTLVKNGMCNFIGSDAHSSTRRRPGLSEAFEIVKNIDEEMAEILEQNSEKLLENENINLCNERIKIKKGFFSFFKRKKQPMNR